MMLTLAVGPWEDDDLIFPDDFVIIDKKEDYDVPW